jgi:hypothetical protein
VPDTRRARSKRGSGPGRVDASSRRDSASGQIVSSTQSKSTIERHNRRGGTGLSWVRLTVCVAHLFDFAQAGIGAARPGWAQCDEKPRSFGSPVEEEPPANPARLPRPAHPNR